MLKIIADSCCDTTPKLREKLDITLVPLHIHFSGGLCYTDTLDLDPNVILEEMARDKDAVRTSCPAVEAYAQEMEKHEACIVITLSSKLSGSYNSARLARNQVLQKHPEKRIHVLDSCSASAGELLLALQIDAFRREGLSFDEIVTGINVFRKRMDTLFVLEDLGNFIKSGRIPKLAGFAASALSLCPIMSDDGAGSIKAVAKVRGMRNSLKRLVDEVAARTAGLTACSVPLTLCYCNCAERANELALEIMRRCHAVREVILAPTHGLSTVYANSGGVILAFQPREGEIEVRSPA